MYISEATLDDLLRRVIEALLSKKKRTQPTRGSAAEILGVVLKLRNPRARLSRTEGRGVLFSCLGELLWYLAGSNRLDFVRYYVARYSDDSEDGKTIHGAYGPRLFCLRGQDQIRNVVNLLRASPYSRRAVIQLFDAPDIAVRRKEIPCTCTLQFVIRNQRLQMITSMRSNDAFLGLPHDVFAFTMLQEIIARELGVELGPYRHFVGSMHLYDEHREKAMRFVGEGWQVTNAAMPPMPAGNPWAQIKEVLQAEKSIRCSRAGNRDLHIDGYWGDLIRLLQIYRCSRDGDSRRISRLKKRMSTPVYEPYITKRERKAVTKKRELVQQTLFN